MAVFLAFRDGGKRIFNCMMGLIEKAGSGALLGINWELFNENI